MTPQLYSIDTADIPKLDYPKGRTIMALYADDTAIAYQIRQPALAMNRKFLPINWQTGV